MKAGAFLTVFAAFGLAMTATPASSGTTFGSKLTSRTQPANAGKGVFCRDDDRAATCTHVMTIARERPNSAVRAPKDGVIKKLRLIACYKGSFVFQLARARPNDMLAKAVHTGPNIKYVGDSNHCNGSRYDIEEFKVRVPVKKGDYLAVLANKVGFVYNAGDNGSLLFDPPLADGDGFSEAFDRGTGIILLQAELDD